MLTTTLVLFTLKALKALAYLIAAFIYSGARQIPDRHRHRAMHVCYVILLGALLLEAVLV